MRKKFKSLLLAACLLTGAMALTACGNDAAADETAKQEVVQTAQPPASPDKIRAYIGDQHIEIVPAENSSGEALVELLAQGDRTVDMHDYGNFEKVGELGVSLPTNDENITTEPGDVILYQGNKIVLYYDTNSWNFTRLGKVLGMSQEQLKALLGEGNVKVTFTIEKEPAEQN